jgi:hypothetical protein
MAESFTKRFLQVVITLAVILVCTEASVLVIPAGDAIPKEYPRSSGASTSLENFFSESAPRAYTQNQEALLSSHERWNAANNLRPSSDSFFRGAIEAWGRHQHFVIRPDEIWFTILVQMSFFMSNTKNSEALRDVFVSHKGKQEIYFMDLNTTRALSMFQAAIQARVKTSWLMDWIVPNYTTTVSEDIMVSNVLVCEIYKNTLLSHDMLILPFCLR